jgi:hypothetical protein
MMRQHPPCRRGRPPASRADTNARSPRYTHGTTGQRITFDTVASQAGVSRSWLYTQDDLRAEIERLRRPRSTTSSTSIPQRQRASEPSLLRRLDTATTRIRSLEAENRQLRDALARTLGERRAADILGQTRPQDTPNNHSSTSADPR